MGATRVSVHLVKGNDAVLLSEAATQLVRDLVGERERAEAVEEFRGDDYELGAVVMAASTVSMFGTRVVVARNLARFPTSEVAELVELVRQPPPECELVLVWDRPITPGARATPLPKALTEAVSAGGGAVLDAGLPSGKARQGWADEQFDAAPVQLDPAARRHVLDVLGEDLHRLGGVLEVLAGAHGEPGRPGGPAEPLGVADVVPYLGEAGGVPPWELTDAIDAGRVGDAVDKLRRLLGGGERHPLQVMVTLQSHYERMLRLDGSGVADEKAAAALLGMKGSTYPAKKAMVQGRKLGSAKVARAVQLLATADVELRGATAAPPEAVMELLVARLAALSGGGAGSRTAGSAPGAVRGRKR
jgi:DNA polymerase-3 subunit delta